MRQELETRFQGNLQRVRSLVLVYRNLAGPGSGRRSVETVDVLRSAVVFLHATLEDVLRALLIRRWASAGARHDFDEVKFVLGGAGAGQAKVTLGDLAVHRGKTVEDVLQLSIAAHLERATFNNVGDVKVALVRGGIGPEPVVRHAEALAAMMTRRHQIVHRADRQDFLGSGNHAGASLGVATVEVWITAVEGLCDAIIAQL